MEYVRSLEIRTVHCVKEDLWFNNEINKFHIVLGEDGAPFVKDSFACSWLISFLNRGKNIISNIEM